VANRSLKQIAQDVDACTRCPLYRHATQGVPGEGPRKSRLMLVGEQPGNDEDLAGEPFIGPAGRLLNGALEEAGIDRDAVFVTNAVKHFKFVPRGKRRLHQRPNAHEIAQCHVWLEQERRLVKPLLTIALGATAARSLFGKIMTISKSRGKILELPDGTRGFVTIHPSLLLRIPDAASKKVELARFIRELRAAWNFVSPTGGAR
jgi:uracil-DNA glycosylase family protein